MRELRLNTVCEEAACPNIGECWKQKPCDGDDPRRRLHARLHLLQCRDRPAGSARPARARARRRGGRRARARACRRHLGRSRRSRRRRRRAFRAHHRGDPRRRRRHDDRGADPGFPAQGRARSKPSSRPSPTSSTTISKPCRVFMPRCGRARDISTRCGCSTGPSGSIRRCSPNRGSWSGSARTRAEVLAGDGRSARRGGRFSDDRPISAADAEASSRSRALSRPRSSRAIRTSPSARGFCWSRPRR